MLCPEEEMILDSKYEIMLVYTKDGRLVSGKIGSRFDSDEPNAPADAILTHNHPRGRGPSDSDITHILRNPERTLRIVARNEHGKVEIYQIRAKKRIPEGNIAKIGVAYQHACDQGGDNHAARRAAVSLILQQFGDIITITTAIL